MTIYIKYADWKGSLEGADMVLMSNAEFQAGGKDIKYVPVCVTPTGAEPDEKYITGIGLDYEAIENYGKKEPV